MDGTYSPTAATTPTRHRGRMRYDEDTVHAILDDAFLAHVSFVADGRPHVLPLAFGRDGRRLYLHVSSGSHLALAVRDAGADGLPATVAVTHVDALLLARSAYHHSLNYRCVIAHGPLRRVTDEAEIPRGYTVLVDHLVPGRSADSRPPNRHELARTALLALDLAEVAARVRSGPLAEEPEDMGLAHWAGSVPIRLAAGTPVPEPDLAGPATVPEYLDRWVAGRR
jgi:nitroimidazol reductase NimA-like FMN-containing flavoprotein (pyridoxamine 5'-phosphate oxidase superfamily)